MAPITIIPKACSCCKGERSSRDKSSNLPLPNILYEGSEGKVDGPSGRGVWPPDGGGLCRRVVKGKVLKMDGPSAGGFLSLTAFQAEGCGGGFAADYKKGAVKK